MNEPQMPALLVAHGRPGFYFRVLGEGEVEAGDEIVRIGTDPEHLSVCEINALLYTPGHPRSQLERALRIPALSQGWRDSFQMLLEQQDTATGNAGLTGMSGPPPTWSGFRPLRVSRKLRESTHVVSLVLEPVDGRPLAAALPGQFIVLRIRPTPDAPALMRSYSLSDEPNTEHYRVSIKREPHGGAGAYVDDKLQAGDVVEVSAARGNFTLRPGDAPIVFLSAGIGVTPVLAMLHALAADASLREVWWLYGTRDRREHAFAEEMRTLLKALVHSHSRICYSSPRLEDRAGFDFDIRGRMDLRVLQDLQVPRDADFYICGPAAFMRDLTVGLTGWGVAISRIHTENFGSAPPKTPGVAASPHPPPHPPAGPPGTGPLVFFARSGLNIPWRSEFQSLLELAEACDVPVRWSCRTGVCHTCETGLVEGKVSYEPAPIDAPADGNLLTCCSKPHGNVVIDL
jgi:ferredoxin-NADP reductase